MARLRAALARARRVEGLRGVTGGGWTGVVEGRSVKDVRAERGMMWVFVVGGAGVVVGGVVGGVGVEVAQMARREVTGQIVKTVPSRVWGVVVWMRILLIWKMGTCVSVHTH